MSGSNLTLPTRTEAEARAQRAYEAELKVRPRYDDGALRPAWDDLCEVAKESWRRNPSPRWTP